jgi:tRNA(Ile)-lysidine synthase TilS/MesJ
MELYKKEQLAVDDKIKIGEDIACTLPCISKARSIYILNEPLYYYRKNNLSMTKNRKAFPWNGPELVYIHHMNRLDCSKYNFQEQINNRTVHALLNVIKTQFYRKEKYLTIRREIKDNIARPIYSSAIKNSKFAVSTPIFLFRLCMLYGFFFPIYLLSKFR